MCFGSQPLHPALPNSWQPPGNVEQSFFNDCSVGTSTPDRAPVSTGVGREGWRGGGHEWVCYHQLHLAEGSRWGPFCLSFPTTPRLHSPTTTRQPLEAWVLFPGPHDHRGTHPLHMGPGILLDPVSLAGWATGPFIDRESPRPSPFLLQASHPAGTQGEADRVSPAWPAPSGRRWRRWASPHALPPALPSLFPTMPRHNLHKIALVRSLCAKHALSTRRSHCFGPARHHR